MKYIENITNGFPTNKKALMFYKTEPFFTNVDRYVHTNNWEILQAIKILNSRGYSVDLIDRTCSNYTPKYKYDIFLGLGVGNSGRHFVKYAKASGAEKRVLLAMGPQPDISNELVLRRYDEFKNRTGFHAPPMRTVTEVTGKNFLDIMDNTDFILCIGERGTNSHKSFLKYNKPILNFLPSISPKVAFKPENISTRKKNTFLCFAGNGFICKGVDIVLEAFLEDASKELHICGPSSETAFFRYYNNKIRNAKNIKFHGFIEPGGEKFNILAKVCAYTIFHSASESCCTAVATTMKAGLVPIINPWTNINIENCGISLSDDGDKIENIKKAIVQASKISDEEYAEMVAGTLKKASLFSQESFTESYTQAISQVIEKEKSLQ